MLTSIPMLSLNPYSSALIKNEPVPQPKSNIEPTSKYFLKRLTLPAFLFEQWLSHLHSNF